MGIVVRKDLFDGMVCDERSRMELVVDKKGGAWRLKNGRFASKGDAIKDEYAHRLAWLEYEREKYKRSYLDVVERWRKSERELRELKLKVQELAKTCRI